MQLTPCCLNGYLQRCSVASMKLNFLHLLQISMNVSLTTVAALTSVRTWWLALNVTARLDCSSLTTRPVEVGDWCRGCGFKAYHVICCWPDASSTWTESLWRSSGSAERASTMSKLPLIFTVDHSHLFCGFYFWVSIFGQYPQHW